MSNKYAILCSLIPVVFSCVTPSEQQANKEKLLEGLKDHQVVRVTEDQIHAAAFEEGHQVINLIDTIARDISYWNTTAGQQILDSLNDNLNHGGIKLVTPNTPSTELNKEELALIDAYSYSSEQGGALDDNVQRTSDGQYLLYTSPLSSNEQFLGMWSILLSRKALIRKMQ